MEDLRFNHHGELSGQSKATGKQIKLQLAISKGQVNVKVNIILAQREPFGLSIVVHSATTVNQLRQLILSKIPEDLNLRSMGESEIILSFKKK